MNRPIVSIIMPILKIDRYLEDCLKSLNRQTYNNIELIIVSDSNVISQIDELLSLKKDIKIKKICIDSKNVGFRRNVGISEAIGKYILFLDADDYYYSDNNIEKLVNYIEQLGGRVLCGSCLINENNNDKYRFDLLNLRLEKTNFKKFQNESAFYRFIYNAEFLKKYQFPLLKRFQDSVFLVEVLIRAKDFYIIPDIVYVYRKKHKTICWDNEMYEDHLNGVFKILNISYSHRYKKLQKKMLMNIVHTVNIRSPGIYDNNTSAINRNFYNILKSKWYKNLGCFFKFLLACNALHNNLKRN